MDVFNLLVRILLVILLVVQIVVMIYLLYINHRRFKEDKKFWAQLDEEVKLTKLKFQHYLDNDSENIVESEQEDQNKE